MTELHQDITYSLLITGHTKFAPDCCFGIIKKAYMVNFISFIYKRAEVIKESSSVGVNKVQLT